MPMTTAMADFQLQLFSLKAGVWYVIAGLFTALLIASLIRMLMLLVRPNDKRRQLLGSLATWWTLAILLTIAVILGRLGIVLLLGVVIVLALREFGVLLGKRAQGLRMPMWCYVVAVLNLFCIFLGWQSIFVVFVPVFVFVFIAASAVLRGVTAGYMNEVGRLTWGMMLLVYLLSHAALFALLPDENNTAGGAEGWFLYVVLLAQMGDIAQAWWGRAIGRHKITPKVSPNKTWEGFVAGVLTNIVLATLLAPLLTPLMDVPPRFASIAWLRFPYIWAPLGGAVISLAGFFGDINMSAVKRDAGVKDSGTLLPGQGGILDRVDSLTFSAPLFFYYAYFLYH